MKLNCDFLFYDKSSVSPPGGDFSDPVTSATLTIVQVFWGLDKKLAQRKHFPSVNWLDSYSRYTKALDPYYESIDPEWVELRTKCKQILTREKELQDIVQLVGQDSLDEIDKLTLDVAEIIKSEYLQQNGYSEYDRYCPFYKTIWMMRNIITFFDLGCKIIGTSEENKGKEKDQKVPYHMIRSHFGPTIHKIKLQKEQLPSDGEPALVAYFKALNSEIIQNFRNLEDSM